MRWLELGLLAAPALAFAAWWFLARRGGPSTRLVAAAVLGLVLMVSLLAWLSERRSLGRSDVYVPAIWQNGHLIPGHGRDG